MRWCKKNLDLGKQRTPTPCCWATSLNVTVKDSKHEPPPAHGERRYYAMMLLNPYSGGMLS